MLEELDRLRLKSKEDEKKFTKLECDYRSLCEDHNVLVSAVVNGQAEPVLHLVKDIPAPQTVNLREPFQLYTAQHWMIMLSRLMSIRFPSNIKVKKEQKRKDVSINASNS